MKPLGDKIKKLRQDAGLTQKQLGDILHVSYQAVSKWERNKGLPDPDTFPALCKALNCSVNDLFYSTDDVIPKNPFLSANSTESNGTQKPGYKPVNRKFFIIIAVAFCVLSFFVSYLIISVVNTQSAKTELNAAFAVFKQEDNVDVVAEINGEEYRLTRKYFFDGRVVAYYKHDKIEKYFYKEKTYSSDNGDIEVLADTYNGFMQNVPCFFDLGHLDDIKSVSKRGEQYVIKLKALNNQPIARYFGFTKDVKVTVILKDGKIQTLTFSQNENILNINYRFGYDFTFSLPKFIEA